MATSVVVVGSAPNRWAAALANSNTSNRHKQLKISESQSELGCISMGSWSLTCGAWRKQCLSSSPRHKNRNLWQWLLFLLLLLILRSSTSVGFHFVPLKRVTKCFPKFWTTCRRIANRPRGFAFLHYAAKEESQKAIKGMHGKFLDGRVIFVEVAKPRSELRPTHKQSPRQD